MKNGKVYKLAMELLERRKREEERIKNRKAGRGLFQKRRPLTLVK